MWWIVREAAQAVVIDFERLVEVELYSSWVIYLIPWVH